MPKHEESWYESSLELEHIRSILGSVLTRAEVSTLRAGPLDDLPPLAILAEQQHAPFKKPKFGAGMAAAQIFVHETDNRCRVQFIALGTSFGQSAATSFAHDNLIDRAGALKKNPALKSSKNMVSALVQAINAVDPHLKQVG